MSVASTISITKPRNSLGKKTQEEMFFVDVVKLKNLTEYVYARRFWVIFLSLKDAYMYIH